MRKQQQERDLQYLDDLESKFWARKLYSTGMEIMFLKTNDGYSDKKVKREAKCHH